MIKIRRGLLSLTIFIGALAVAGSTADAKVSAKDDAEILAIVMAINENEVHAAATAEEKRVAEPVPKKSLQDTKELIAKIGVTPTDTPAVAQLRKKGKQQLARLMPLSGDAFKREFLSAMRKDHRAALQMLDGFLETAKNEELKVHLTETRQSVAMHLQTAENLRKS